MRPATPRLTLRRNALVGAGKSLDLGNLPAFFAPTRQAGVAFSPSPMALADGLTAYLYDYPYYCTEQLVSQGLPAIVLAARPAYGRVLAQNPTAQGLSGLFEALRNRQADDGLFRYWPEPSGDPDMEVSVYTQQMLAEATERGIAVPADLVADADAGLTDIARREGGLPELRTSARAVWLLARRGVNASAEADRVAARLATVANGSHDIASAWLAAAFKLMQAQDRARTLVTQGALSRPPQVSPATIAQAPSGFGVGPMAQAEWLYIIAKYFPEKLDLVRPEDLTSLLTALENDPGSLLAGETLLAFDAYDKAVGAASPGSLTVSAAGHTLALNDGRATLTDVPPTLLFANATARPAFASVSLAGFPAKPPEAANKGIEMVREILGPDGKAITSVAPGTEVTVRLRLRALGGSAITRVAVTDLLPGGFEVVVPPPAAPSDAASADASDSADAGTDDSGKDNSGDSDGEAADGPASDADGGNTAADTTTSPACFVCVEGTTLWPEHFDVREDRVIFFATVGPSASEIRYRLRATTTGLYTLPAALAEAMYAPSVRALTKAGQLKVVAPARK